MAPDFYTDDKLYLRTLATTLQKLYEGYLMRTLTMPFKKIIINMPPRFGKTRTLILFTMWCLGDDPTNRVITTSYNDKTAADFSRGTRDGIAETKNLPHQIVFNDIFPWSKIKEGNASFEKWALEGQFFSYIGAGIGGSITGKGGNILIIDDPVKDAAIAMNADALEKIYKWYTGTFLSRKEKNAIEIINMTRWADEDVTGKVLSEEGCEEWYVFKFEAKDLETGEFLCEDIIGDKRYRELKRDIDELIFMANYHQEPINQRGRLYKDLKIYKRKEIITPERRNIRETHLQYPRDWLFDRIVAYVDTADEGDCYLSAVIAGELDGDAYMLDAYYTKEDMSVTEEEVAHRLSRWYVDLCKVESNNGGRGFSRAVQRVLREKYNDETQRIIEIAEKKGKKPEEYEEARFWKRVPIKWFHQSENKDGRILSNSSYLINHVFFPYNWHIKWPKFHKAMTTYQREGTNKYKDAPDAMTGLVEMLIKSRPRARLI